MTRTVLSLCLAAAVAAGCGSSVPAIDAAAVTDASAPVDAVPDARPVLRSGTLPGVGFYPRVLRVARGAAAGQILATTDDGVIGRVYRSTDEGASFTEVSRIEPGADAVGLCCLALYELPVALGSHPAGTLLWAASVTTSNGPHRQMDLRVFRSDDGGVSWTRQGSCARSQAGGLWEPDFHVGADGRLACLYSDETDAPAHSQRLLQAFSDDGGETFGAPRALVVSTRAYHRPGMVTTLRRPDGSWLMTFELCGEIPSCAVHLRRSRDGVDWGAPDDLGEAVHLPDGTFPAHTPVLGWSPAGGPGGTLILSAQMVYDSGFHLLDDSGRVLLVNRTADAASGGWQTAPAPVEVSGVHDDFCPNYSSPVLDLDGRGTLLELASGYHGSDCVTSWGVATLGL